MSPAIGKAKALQGAQSTLADLKLRDGRRFIDLAGSVLSAELTRTIDGASTVEITVYDPDRDLLRNGLLSSKWDASLDGIPFRYLSASKQGKNLTVTLIDRNVAKMREHLGPKQAFREETTRAEFIKSLFREACPGLTFYCPELHDKQPIKTAGQAKKAKSEADQNRGKGIGDGKGLTVKGEKATAGQRELGDEALRQAENLKAPLAVRIALIEALIMESLMGEESSNVLQGTEGKNSGATHDIHGFLTGEDWTLHGAIPYYRAHTDAKPYEIAQAVQASGAGSASNGRANYGTVEREAREWVEEFSGGDLSGSVSVTEPFVFEVKADKGEGRPEDYWDAGKRLASEVNWRLFLLPDRAVLMDELDLIRAKVRLAIDDDTEGVEDIDFDFNGNKPLTELEIDALVAQWAPPPATVVTLADYGPASLGPGDPPQKGKQKTGLSSAVKASTHEGKGRYLVSTIATPLTEDAEARLGTITCRRPTPPLPEPAPQTSSVTVQGGDGIESAAGNTTVERMIQAAEAEVAKGRPYAWGGGHGSFAGPYDCSGFVSYLLHVGGFLDTPEATTGLAAWGETGAGEFVTVYVKTSGGSSEEHTMIEVGGNFFMSGGGENPNANDGPCKFSPSSSYKAEFNVKRHPSGF